MKSSKAKNFTMVAIVYLSVLAIYNLVIFLLFKNLNNVFWISYGFMTAAVLANVATVFLLSKNTDVEAAFFGIPLISFSVFHVAAELFASLVFMIFRDHVSVQLTVTIQAILLLIFVIFGAVAIFSRDTVQGVSEKIKTNVFNIKSLAVEVQLLEEDCIDKELKEQLHKVREAINYSDPMTNDSVAQIDELIKSKVSELKYLCQENNKNEAIQVCLKLNSYIKERNGKLLISK